MNIMKDILISFCLIYTYDLVVDAQGVDEAAWDEGSVEVDDALAGTLRGVEGSNITLICDLRGIYEEDIWFSNETHFLTAGNHLSTSLPLDIANRISVTCESKEEACYLTIHDLRSSDAGRYSCGYIGLTRRTFVASATLEILVPPKDTSPVCKLIDTGNNVISPDMAQVDDPVAFYCIIEGGDPIPSVYVARDGVGISDPVRSIFSKYYEFSQNDVGSTFTCVMTHPALSQPRNCTFLTLISMRTLTVSQSPKTPTIVRTAIPEITTVDFTEESNTGERQQASTMSPGLIIVVSIFAIVIACLVTLLIVIWCKRSRQSVPAAVKVDKPNPVDVESHQPNIDHTYLDVDTKRESHEYAMVQTQPIKLDNTGNDAYATPDNDECAYASPDEVKSTGNGREDSQNIASASYANAAVLLKGKIPKK